MPAGLLRSDEALTDICDGTIFPPQRQEPRRKLIPAFYLTVFDFLLTPMTLRLPHGRCEHRTNPALRSRFSLRA